MTFNKTMLTVPVIACAMLCGTASAQQKQLDRAEIDRITGAKGTLNTDENVYKVSFPRDDVKVSVDGVRCRPLWASPRGRRSNRG
jgi:hypothetical protein